MSNIYRVDDLKHIMSAAQTKDAKEYDRYIAVAAAYAMDLVEFAADDNIKLDLSFDSEVVLIEKVMPKFIIVKRLAENDVDEARDQLGKTLASYELFMLCNFINETVKKFGAVATIVLNAFSRMGIVLKVINPETKKWTSFDPYAVISKHSEACFILPDDPYRFSFYFKPFADDFRTFLDSVGEIMDEHSTNETIS